MNRIRKFRSENIEVRIIREAGQIKSMDKVAETFDKWAGNGKAESMEAGHGTNVLKFLKSMPFDRPFTFLDVGCGNGWLIRRVAAEKNCKRAVGIDKSRKMIMRSEEKKMYGKEKFIHTDIESMRYRGRFDFIFSMESLYYADSLKVALERIYKLLVPGGRFFCGTDFYAENQATARWAGIMKIRMHLHSKKEWKSLFKSAGFEVRTRHVKDPKSREKWKRQYGTLFITGTKP